MYDVNSMTQPQLIQAVKGIMKAHRVTQMQVCKEAKLSSNAMVSLWINRKLQGREDVDSKIRVWLAKQQELLALSASAHRRGLAAASKVEQDPLPPWLQTSRPWLLETSTMSWAKGCTEVRAAG